MEFTSLPVFREPLCIIESEHDGTLCIKDEVLDQIALLDKKLHIVTIVGLYRTGKSYLLNRIAGVNKGFPLGSTIKAQTKGIWAWCHPHPVYTDHVLVLLDSEGLGDVEKGDSNHDFWILALAVLLSSTLVYNIIGTFSEYDLEKLSFVTEISNYIRISAKGNGEGDTNYDQFFPMFILSMRDFSLTMINEDREITPDEYLEEFCLNVQEEKTDKERRYNKTRTSIRKYFKTRKCFTFDRPGSRTVLQALKEMDYVELSKDFLEDCDKFIKYIHEECPVKMVDNGCTVNGSMLATLVRSYVEAIRNGSVPCVEDALSTMAETENKKLLESCCEIYTREMGVILKLPTPDEQTLLDAHQQCMNKAADYFLEKYIYDKDKKFQMEAKVLEVYEKYKRENEVASVECCEKALQDLNAKMLEKLQKESYCRPGGYVEYMSDLNELQEKYMRLEGLGCKKEETLLKFLDRKHAERTTIEQADIKMTEKEEEVKKERNRADAEAREKVEIERHAEKSRVEFEEKIREKDKNCKQLEENIVAEITKIKDETDKVVEERVAKEKSKKEDKLLEELEKLNKQTRYLQQNLERQEREQQQMVHQITRLKAENNQYFYERQLLSRSREENSSRCSLS
ncbi:hypothetical protein CHS0354_006524 [Potamilus streckersoni]|uniref:GB1/RHD3-type G domain-containing protein n=1 Tax=Potamilus streckersoni TaxID=2493646 RepID=A0AAE0TCZ2_9BIVA|nr:hypothetical protein CHS0354_006524 [Potamilus streckersoni]